MVIHSNDNSIEAMKQDDSIDEDHYNDNTKDKMKRDDTIDDDIDENALEVGKLFMFL